VRGAPTPFATRINAVLLCAEGVFLLASDAAKTALRLHVTDRTWRGSGSASGFAGIPCFDQRRGSFRIRRFMIVDGSTACAELSTSSHSPASFLQPDRSALAALLGKWVRKVNCSRALSERTPTGPRRRVAGVSHGSFPNQTAIDKHSHFLPLQRCLQGIRCAGPDDGNCHRGRRGFTLRYPRLPHSALVVTPRLAIPLPSGLSPSETVCLFGQLTLYLHAAFAKVESCTETAHTLDQEPHHHGVNWRSGLRAGTI
jgi:hypothetical protein